MGMNVDKTIAGVSSEDLLIAKCSPDDTPDIRIPYWVVAIDHFSRQGRLLLLADPFEGDRSVYAPGGVVFDLGEEVPAERPGEWNRTFGFVLTEHGDGVVACFGSGDEPVSSFLSCAEKIECMFLDEVGAEGAWMLGMAAVNERPDLLDFVRFAARTLAEAQERAIDALRPPVAAPGSHDAGWGVREDGRPGLRWD